MRVASASFRALQGRFIKSPRADFINSGQRGGALLEFAIIAPLLLIILFGIIEFGLILYNKAVLTNASREGARYGILERTPRYSGEDISNDVVLPYCNNRLITFRGTAVPAVQATSSNGTAPGNDLKVEVSWTYNFLAFPALSMLGFAHDGLMLSARTVMNYE
jgi:Flp pilus assembly protein TadG